MSFWDRFKRQSREPQQPEQRSDSVALQAPQTPEEKRVSRRDAFFNRRTGVGTLVDPRTYTEYVADVVTDQEARELWRGNHIAANIIEVRPREAMRRGFTLKIDGDKQLVEDIMAGLEDLGVAQSLVQAAQYENAYGGAAIMPIFNDGARNFSAPLDLDAENSRIPKISRLHVLEARELVPDRYYDDITSPKYGMPETYFLQPIHPRTGASPLREIIIHETRLVVFPGARVSKDQTDGSVTGWGDSCLTRPKEVLNDYGHSWGSVAPLLSRFAQGVLKMDGLAELMAQDKDDLVLRRMITMDQMQSNLRSLVIDGKDDYQRQNVALGGAADLLDKMMTHMASAAGYPVVILLGLSPNGWNTGDMDIRSFYDRTDGWRNHHLLPRLEHLIKFFMRSNESPTKGREPDVWSAEFNPLMQPSQKEDADTKYVIAQTDALLIDKQVLTPDEVRQRYIGDTFAYDIQVKGEIEREAIGGADLTAELARLQAESLARRTLPPGEDPNIEEAQLVEPDFDALAEEILSAAQ